MKNTFLRSIAAITLALLILVGGAHVSALAQDDQKSGQNEAGRTGNRNRNIVGVWIIQVTRRNCDTGEPMGPSFQTQNTFAKGGTLLETVAPSIFRSYGNGIWKRKRGWSEYSLIQRFMRYDPTGAFIGSAIVRASITLDDTGDHYTSTATNDFLDANGNVTASGCATSVATRLLHE